MERYHWLGLYLLGFWVISLLINPYNKKIKELEERLKKASDRHSELFDEMQYWKEEAEAWKRDCTWFQDELTKKDKQLQKLVKLDSKEENKPTSKPKKQTKGEKEIFSHRLSPQEQVDLGVRMHYKPKKD